MTHISSKTLNEEGFQSKLLTPRVAGANHWMNHDGLFFGCAVIVCP